MALILKKNGQKFELNANPDLLYDLLVSVTNLEERINSIDKRLYNLEKKSILHNEENLVSDQNKAPYLIKKRIDI